MQERRSFVVLSVDVRPVSEEEPRLLFKIRIVQYVDGLKAITVASGGQSRFALERFSHLRGSSCAYHREESVDSVRGMRWLRMSLIG